MKNLMLIVFCCCVFYYQNQAFSLDLPPNGKFESVKVGETLISILRKNGWNSSHIGEVLQHKEARDFTLYPNIEYLISRSKNSSMIIFFEIDADNALIFQKTNNVAKISYDEIEYDKRDVTVKGKVVGSLQASILAKVPSTAIAQRFMNAYVMDYNLKKKLQRNADFALTYERKYLNNTFIKYGEVLQTSLDIGGKLVTRNFVTYPRGGAFIDPVTSSGKPLYAPVEYLNISSLFQPRRRHPITKRVIPHMGIDFELSTGAPVFSVAAGRVIRSGKNRAAGNFVVIRHESGIESFYNHLSEYNVQTGQEIRAGQQIAEIGCTGYCTKAHLHFALKKGGKFVDPATYLKPYPYHKRSKVEDYRISYNKTN